MDNVTFLQDLAVVMIVAGVVTVVFHWLKQPVVLGLLVVPRLLRYVGRLRGDETLLVAVLGLCFGLALLAISLRAHFIRLYARAQTAIRETLDRAHPVKNGASCRDRTDDRRFTKPLLYH